MIFHQHDHGNGINSNRVSKLIHAADRQFVDGYNKIGNLIKVLSIDKSHKEYTNITIDVGVKSEAEDLTNDDIENKEYEVSVKLLIVLGVCIIVALWKSRLLHYIYKRHLQATKTSYRSLEDQLPPTKIRREKLPNHYRSLSLPDEEIQKIIKDKSKQ